KTDISQMRDKLKSNAYQGLGMPSSAATTATATGAAGTVSSEGAGVLSSEAPGAASAEPETMSSILKNNASQYLQSKVYNKLGVPMPQAASAQAASSQATVAGAAPPLAPPINASAAAPDYAALQAQNQQLQSQLLAAQQQLQNSVQNGSLSQSAIAQAASQYGLTPELAQYAMSAAPSTLPMAMAALPSGMPGATQAVGNVAGHLRPPMPPAAPVKFELEGVKPSPTGINLRVVLRNQKGTTLNLPGHTTAVVRTTGMKDQEVKVSFPGKSIPPGGELHGTVHVPGHHLSPSSDLYLPELLSRGSEGDVHLTVPISSL
ncbi:MAG TPA: hypothetical protein V6C72_18265, partial [Chroococcales cyanobacterium]